MDQSQAETPAPRSSAGWIAGTVILAVLSGFLSMLRDRTSTRTGAYVIGTFFGGALVVGLIGLIIYGIARAVGKGKPTSSAAKIVFWIVLVMVILNAAQFLGSAMATQQALAQAGFTREERQGLRVGTDSIAHAGLGFALPHPGTTFAPSPEVEGALAAQFGGALPPDLIYWAFLDGARRQQLILQLIAVPGLNEEKFREAARGMRKSTAEFKKLSDTTVWEGPRRETAYVRQHPNGLYFAARCVPSLKPRREYIVCVQTFSDEPTPVIAARNGLRAAQ